MSVKLSKKEKLFSFVSIFIILILLVGAYFLIISPKKAQVTLKETELKSQEQLLAAVQIHGTTSSSITAESTIALQKKVPVKPRTEELLLDIEKAEVVSGSLVTNMQFGDSDMSAQSDLEKQVESQLNTGGTTDKTAGNNSKVNKQTATSLPTGLKKLTVDMSIESPSYTELEKFIAFLEQSERIIVIEAIDYSANDEIISNEQSDKILTYKVKLSAFYMPTLSDLISQLPKLETPKPANKKNPFSRFGDYSSEKVENQGDSLTNEPPTNNQATDQTNVNTDTQGTKGENTANSKENKTNNIVIKYGKQYKVTSYKVQKGDTFFLLAVKFYNNNKGMDLIKSWNKITELKTGTTIKIPIPVNEEN